MNLPNRVLQARGNRREEGSERRGMPVIPTSLLQLQLSHPLPRGFPQSKTAGEPPRKRVREARNGHHGANLYRIQFIHNHVLRHARVLDPCVPGKTYANADGQSNSQENELAHLTSTRSPPTAALSPMQPATAAAHFLRPSIKKVGKKHRLKSVFFFYILTNI